MSPTTCPHTDVREFDDMRSCLACGETWFRGHSAETKPSGEIKPYVYSDLRCLEIGQIIRVVVIEPGEEPDPLHCTLDLSDLRHTNYHAVSYTWATEDGDDTKSEPIFIDGARLYVTKNCDAALRRIRRLGPHSRVWVDAICINQASLKERNHQVGLMDQIYRNARRVHACIEDPGSDYSDTVRWLASNPTRDFYSNFYSPHMDQICKLFRCRYFSRVWVVQEIALAKVVTLHVNKCDLDLTREVISLIRRLAIRAPAPLKALELSGSHCSLKNWLKSSLKAASSDPRDKVYAILSLLSVAESKSIVLDYSLSTEEVFMNAVLVCIANSQNLDILVFARQLDGCCNFSIEHFNEYIESSDRRYIYWQIAEKPKTWTYSIHLEDPEGACPFAPRKRTSQLSSPVRIIRQTLPPGQILPCLRVRAHRLDHVQNNEEFGRSVAEFMDAIEAEQIRRRTEEISREYLAQSDAAFRQFVLDSHDLSYASGSDTLSSYSDELLRSFFTTLNRLTDRSGYDIVFVTRHGLGVSQRGISSGDCVYLSDGVDQALVLRPLVETVSEPTPAIETRCRRFRIISRCWWQRACSSSYHSEEEDKIFTSETCISCFGLPSSLVPEFIEVY